MDKINKKKLVRQTRDFHWDLKGHVSHRIVSERISEFKWKKKQRTINSNVLSQPQWNHN